MPGLLVEGIEGATAIRSRPADALNVAEVARAIMARHPQRAAFILSADGTERIVTFGEVGALTDRFAGGLAALNLRRGARVLLLAPPNPEIYALALAVLRTGHVLVTIDGRGDVSRIRLALRQAAADVVVGVPRAMRWWPFVSALRRARRFTVGRPVFGTRALDELLERVARPQTLDVVDPDSPAVIAFSSGNTGLPKLIVRTHAVLSAQHRALLAAFPLPDTDVNLPGFPLAVLHNLCRGTTTVIPAVDLRSMPAADVTTVVHTIRDQGVTSISAAPAFIRRVAAHARSSDKPLRGVRRIVIGGGPVSRRLAADVLAAFPNADARAVYGATEAEPIATASLREIVDAADLGAEGYLGGWPVGDIEVRIAGGGDRGELLVRGRHVVQSQNDGRWHHTGDICRMDQRGRLWLLGRIGTDIRRDGRTLNPFVIEAPMTCLPGVAAAALVAHRDAPRGELIIEVEADADSRSVMASVRQSLPVIGFGDIPARQIDRIPMDARHESKVDRAALIRRLEEAGR